MIMRLNPTTRTKPARLEITTNQPRLQLAQTQNLEDGDIPFSEILSLLERLGTDAGLAIETAQMKLFDLEALLTFNILHDNNDDLIRAERFHRSQEMYQQNAVVGLVHLLFYIYVFNYKACHACTCC